MSEWRTQEQVDADEALSRAIERNLAAYAEAEGVASPLEGRAIGDFVVVVTLPGITEELGQSTAYEYILANGSISWHSMSGLFRWATLMADAKMMGRGTDDE